MMLLATKQMEIPKIQMHVQVQAQAQAQMQAESGVQASQTMVLAVLALAVCAPTETERLNALVRATLPRRLRLAPCAVSCAALASPG